MSRQDSKQIENVKVMFLKGENGSSIESIEKTGTSGAVDTYTITLTDGSKFTFTVTNGATITNIAKTSTSDLVDTYTITMSDGTTSTFTVTNGADGADGVGIVSIAKTSTSGSVDTYTITLSNGQTSTFTVTNATGVVDASLDTNSTNAIQNKAVAEKFNAVDDDIATTENGTTASKTYAVGEFILRDNQFYKVKTAIASGGTFTVGVNIEAKSIGEVLSELNSKLNFASGQEKLVDMGNDANTLVGIMGGKMSISNAPSNFPTILTLPYANDIQYYASQIAIDVTNGDIFSRIKVDQVWQLWKKLLRKDVDFVVMTKTVTTDTQGVGSLDINKNSYMIVSAYSDSGIYHILPFTSTNIWYCMVTGYYSLSNESRQLNTTLTVTCLCYKV